MSSGQLAIFDQQQCAHGWWRGQWYHERKYDNVEATIATETFGNRYPTQDDMTMPKMNMTMPKPPKTKFINALDATNVVKYDMLVQACLATGAKYIIGVHNYARFNDLTIG
jgi:hypothetical protein